MREYANQVRKFSRNARLYLLNVVIIGAAMGVFRLLFNFYVLSLGYNEALVGSLITVSSEIGLPRLPAGMRIMIAARAKVPVWTAQDIGADAAQLDKANAHTLFHYLINRQVQIGPDNFSP